MTVKRDFHRLYLTEEDPWGIGDASADRYDVVLESLRAFVQDPPLRMGIDLGCGKGAFTARVAPLVGEMWGVDISSIAIEKARERFAAIRFLQGDIRRIGSLGLPNACFDLVLCLDVLNYLTPREKLAFLAAVDQMLSPSGVVVFGGWSPGGNYLTPDEFLKLVGHHFHVQLFRSLETEHVIIVARRRFMDVILSLDYETWQPIPAGKRIDWSRDVIRPTDGLMEVTEAFGAKLTLMAEMAEYYWLQQHRPDLAGAIEGQLRKAVESGHDVQLHLHPSWLPELGARYNPEGDSWTWDFRYRRLHDLPFPMEELLERSKKDLESLLQPIRPAYRTVAFRAGKYQVQPSLPVFRALVKVGILADSSVWKGGYDSEHGFDFRSAFSANEPYWASPYQVNYLAPPGEEEVLELPIATHEGGRLSLDGLESERLIRLLRKIEGGERLDRLPLGFPRVVERLRDLLFRHPRLLRLLIKGRLHRILVVLPAPASTLVLIGHPKVGIDPAQFSALLAGLSAFPRVRFRTMQQVVEERVRERDLKRRLLPPRTIHTYQVLRDRSAVLGKERNWRQSHHLQERIPLDRTRILDVGCGAGYWTRRLSDLVAPTVGMDVGHEFLVKARTRYGVPVAGGEIANLPFGDDTFDAVYADNSLEHVADPGQGLREIFRILRDRGILVAMIPPDARHPEFSGTDHLWKTDRDEIELRLREAGFSGITIQEVDVVQAFHMPPYLPSGNAMLVISAWRWNGGFSPVARVLDLMGWVYGKLSPERSQEGEDPREILRKGYAWCGGYVNVFQYLATQEGIESRVITLKALHHPRGHGPRGEETHEIVEVKGEEGWIAFDPMANKCLKHGVRHLLRQPSLASEALADQPEDDRFRARGYHLYCSPWFYEQVAEVAVRPTYHGTLHFIPRKVFVGEPPE